MTDVHERTGGWSALHYDHRATKVAVSPFDLWRRLRDQCPVLWSEQYGGFWFVSRHEDVNRVLVDWETFTAAEGVNIPRQAMPMLPLEVDPPLHRQYRSILNPSLAPQRVAPQEPWVRAEARRRLAALAGRDRFDVAADFAEDRRGATTTTTAVRLRAPPRATPPRPVRRPRAQPRRPTGRALARRRRPPVRPRR